MSSGVPPSQPPVSLQFGNSETTGSSQSFSGFVAGSVQFHSGQDRLDALPRAEGASFNSVELEHERLCLAGTRTKVLDLIEQWTLNPQGERVFWLSGLAGTGKSAIARTLAHKLSDKSQLGASFFFSRGRGDRGNASKFFTSIAYQLALLDVENGALARSIRKAIDRYPDIFKRAKRDQWKHLIQEPLSQLKSHTANGMVLVLVIDAMDECDNDEDVKLILRLLCESEGFGGIHFRVFVTGRPRISVRDAFLETLYQSLVLHEIERYIVQGDLRIFFGHELGNLQKRGRLTLSEDEIDTLVQRAGELFIYATTICSFVAQKKHPPHRKRLEIVLQDNVSTTSPQKNLDRLYTHILREAVSTTDSAEERSIFCSHFRVIIGSIVKLFSPLSVSSLAALLLEKLDSIELTLDNLLSILNVTDVAISLIRPSFRDFLLDKNRCNDNDFWVDSAETHLALAKNSLRLMAASLRRDICDLHSPGILIEEINPERVRGCIPIELEYACTYWVRHLESSVQDNDTVLGPDLVLEIRRFLELNTLYWLEALSLLGKMQESILMLSTLLSIIQSCDDTRLVRLVNDAYRFVLEHRFTIEQAPLQAYCSALLFSPRESILRKLFESQSLFPIKNISEIPDGWSSLMQTLEAPTGIKPRATEAIFSPDGEKLVWAFWSSRDSTVYTFDARTGKLLHTLQSKDFNLTSVKFLLFDGQEIAAVRSETVEVWDVISGSPLLTIHESDEIVAAALSPTGQRLAFGFRNGSVRVWDINSGRHVQTFSGHASDVMSVEFSPNGQKLASICQHRDTILIWDLGFSSRSTLKIYQQFRLTSALTFSPNGQRIACGCGFFQVEIWDAESRTLLQTLDIGHHFAKGYKGIAFLLNEQHLASWDADGTVGVWNIPSGSLLRTFKRDEKERGDFTSFSPNGQRLASVSHNNFSGLKIKIWDAIFESPLSQELQGHDDFIKTLVFSPYGQKLASLSSHRSPHKSTIRLWNVATGSLLETITHPIYVTSVLFLADGAELPPVAGEYIWNAKCGVRLRIVTNALSWIDIGIHYYANQLYGLDVSSRWVLVNQKRVIWLPIARKAFTIASFGTKVAIGSVSGVVTILDMDPELIETSMASFPNLEQERAGFLDEIYASDDVSTGDDLDTEDEDTEMEISELEDSEMEDSDMENVDEDEGDDY